MKSDEAKELSDRDQLWASLRGLQPEIERLAAGEFNNTERERQLAMVIARIVVAEMKMRARDGASD